MLAKLFLGKVTPERIDFGMSGSAVVDYDKGDEPEFAGQVKIRMEHPEAAAVRGRR